MNGRPLPDVILERYRLGELPPRERDAVRARLEGDPALRAAAEALERSDAAILSAQGPAAMARAIEARAERLRSDRRAALSGRPHSADPRADFGGRPDLAGSGSRSAGRTPRPWFFRPFLAAPAGLALACALLLTVRHAGDSGNAPVTEAPEAYAVRLKGSEAGLAIFRKARGGAELLPPHALAKPGDTLQVFYHSRGPAYGVIFSVDGSGAVTLHLPEAGSAAAALQAGDLLPLPHAYRLDRAPKLERFFLITAPGPFAIDGLLARARASFAVHRAVPDSLEGLAAGMRQYPYTLRKPGRGGRAP
jgi:hypothetical protein